MYIYIYTYIHTYIYAYIWKCHKETPCIAILNKQKAFFPKQKDKTGPVWGLVPEGGEGYKGRV
jgi:hypothetical protein